jgi:hypothetical protein
MVGIQFALLRNTLTPYSAGNDCPPKRSKQMRQMIGKTFGIAMASMCLFSTLAMAQPAVPGQTLVCTKVDANGYCIEAKAQDNKMVTVRVEDVKVSEKITCITENGLTTCTKITVTK